MDKMDPNDVRFFGGSSNQELASAIARHLDIPLDGVSSSKFANDNLSVSLEASVRSRLVLIVQSLSPPVSDHLLELLMMINIARGAGAREIHAIVPYFSFARSDKKDKPRICITARLVADLLVTAGATHFMTMTLHSPQVHGFFSIPADPLTSRPLLAAELRTSDLSGTIVVAPDVGHAKSAARFADDLGLPVAAGIKERLSDAEVRIRGIFGESLQRCHRALIYDDEVSTGGSVVELARVLLQRGIREIWVACTHGVFVTGEGQARSGLERLIDIPEITRVVTTDTVAIPQEKRHPKLKMVPAAPLFAEAILRNYRHESIGPLAAF